MKEDTKICKIHCLQNWAKTIHQLAFPGEQVTLKWQLLLTIKYLSQWYQFVGRCGFSCGSLWVRMGLCGLLWGQCRSLCVTVGRCGSWWVTVGHNGHNGSLWVQPWVSMGRLALWVTVDRYGSLWVQPWSLRAAWVTVSYELRWVSVGCCGFSCRVFHRPGSLSSSEEGVETLRHNPNVSR